MKTFSSSETILLASNSPPGDDVDIDFRDVFGGPPKRRSKAKEAARHSFNETALRHGDVVDGALIPLDEKPVFGDDSSSVRRRFTSDDFFDDIFRVSEKMSKNESSVPGSRILSPNHKAQSPPAQFSLPTFGGSATTRSSSSPLSRSSSKADMVSSAVVDDDAHPQVVNEKGRQFHFSIYKWPNKGVPVIIWRSSSRLSSMSKAEETTTTSDLRSTSVEKDGKDEGESSFKKETKRHDVQPETLSVDTSKTREANVKPLHSFLDDKDDKQGEDIVSEKEVRKGKDSTRKKKPQGERSSMNPIPDNKPSFASSSAAPEVVKDGGGKAKVMDFVKIFSQGASAEARGESLGKSSRWRAKETPKTDINNETVNIHEQPKKSTPDIPVMDRRDQKPSQATPKKNADKESLNKDRTSDVFEQEKKQEQSKAHTIPEDIDEPFHVNFVVEEITQVENKPEETKKDAEEIENIDAKIRKWSSGKSGNIRSLLSTLQYILWPGSGWKAVPLMDMIEGNAVRKSYQRALLILHPDKLQQKGASANQKYMAEKVFELLQEAWDHFNTLGPV